MTTPSNAWDTRLQCHFDNAYEFVGDERAHTYRQRAPHCHMPYMPHKPTGAGRRLTQRVRLLVSPAAAR